MSCKTFSIIARVYVRIRFRDSIMIMGVIHFVFTNAVSLDLLP